MAGEILQAENLTLFQILSSRQVELQIRLLRSLPEPETDISFDDLQECNFPGYTPQAALPWQTIVPLTDGTEMAIGALFQFNVTETVASQLIEGVCLTWQPAGELPVILAITTIPTRIVADAQGQKIFVRLSLWAQRADLTDAQAKVRIAMVADVVATLAEGPRRFTGVERAQLQKALTLLLSLQARDLQISTLTAKSQKSRVPVFDTRDLQLVEAFNTVTERLRRLLDQ